MESNIVYMKRTYAIGRVDGTVAEFVEVKAMNKLAALDIARCIHPWIFKKLSEDTYHVIMSE